MMTKPITAILAATCLALPLWPLLQGAPASPPQTPGEVEVQTDVDEQTPAEPEPKPDLKVGDWTLAAKWEGLLGAWQMMELVHSSEIVPPGSIRGIVTFQAGFMNMIIHAQTVDDEPEPLGQAGTYRWQMTPEGILQTATMMGHSNFGDEFEWEPPNVPREFRVELKGNDLTLTRPDLSRLIFRRVTPGKYPESALRRIDELRGPNGE